MERFTHRCIVIITLLAAASASTSCIYDRPAGDYFYRTLWSSAEAPFDGLTLEFLCGGSISAQATNAAGSFGTYQPEGQTAYFTDLHLIIDKPKENPSGLIIIEEAHRTNDLLIMYWHYSGSTSTRHTRLHRLSSYE